MNEDYRFLDLKGERIFVAHHRPARGGSRAVVMCHPLGEEKLWSHRVFVSFARALADAGIGVLRFDFRGEGDSDRDFERANLETRVEDACFAVDKVRELDPSVTDVTLLGLRFGAAVAAAAAVRHGNVARLVLWDPVIDGAAYMQGVLRLNLMFQMALHQKVVENREALVARLVRGETINIEGYELAEPLFRQASDFRLPEVLTTFAGDLLIVQVGPTDAPLKPDLVALTEGRPRWRLEAVNEEPFWKEIKTFYQRAGELTRVTLDALGVTA